MPVVEESGGKEEVEVEYEDNGGPRDRTFVAGTRAWALAIVRCGAEPHASCPQRLPR